MKEMPLTSQAGGLADKLKRMRIFDSLDEQQIASIAEYASLRKYDPGETLICEGDCDDTLYFLISGELAILHEGVDVGTIRRLGDVFGEMGVLDGSPRSATIRAVTPVLCLSIAPGFLEGLDGEAHTQALNVFYRAFAEILAIRLRDALNQISDLEVQVKDLEASLFEKKKNEIDQ
ncbi:MAG: cyclic nucleotide-binding domain-containing protein [Proteobacteria bacterium]|nr:cyclic nucleotide-binding domain-containing protein [Pseudomonadota bacterium]